jgi:hypothetical protein
MNDNDSESTAKKWDHIHHTTIIGPRIHPEYNTAELSKLLAIRFRCAFILRRDWTALLSHLLDPSAQK